MELNEALNDIRTLCPTIAPVTLDTHAAGLLRAERYGLSGLDGLVVAAALEARCATLWSKDMHHGLVIDERLKILNPLPRMVSRARPEAARYKAAPSDARKVLF